MEKAFLELKECKTLEQVNAFITKTFPKGLDTELHRPTFGFCNIKKMNNQLLIFWKLIKMLVA